MDIRIQALSIVAVWAVLLTLIIVGGQPWTAVAVIVVLVSLLLVIGGKAHLLPAVMRYIVELVRYFAMPGSKSGSDEEA